MLYGVPALVCGYFICETLFVYVSNLMFSYAAHVTSYVMTKEGWIYGLVFGTVIPLICNYMPSRKALGKTLRESLDKFHQSITEVKITIVKLEQMGISAV